MPETNFFWDPLSDNILQERDETGHRPVWNATGGGIDVGEKLAGTL